MSAHHTPVLGKLRELNLQDAMKVDFVPTLCTRQPQSLALELSDSGVRLCHCHHAWLKAAADAGATVTTAAAVCAGYDWHSLTTAQFLAVCEQHNHHRKHGYSYTHEVCPLKKSTTPTKFLDVKTLPECLQISLYI